MTLSELNPYVIHDRVLWFDCPVHPRDPGSRCRGQVGIRLSPGTDGIDHGLAGWTWSGDWTTWTVTIRPSVKMDLLCGAHFSITDGVISPA